MKNTKKLLFIDDDKNFRELTSYVLKEAGFNVTTAANGREGLEKLTEDPPSVILCDLKMPVMDGMTFLNEVKEISSAPPVIVITAFGSIESAVEAMRAGAFDYVTKPVNNDALTLSIERALKHQMVLEENRRLRERVAGGKAVDQLIGNAASIVSLRDTILKLSESDASVLVRGESGVGKELVARALHFDGPRADTGQFVILNCAAVPGELLESELFGHRKGAFTGAISDRTGKFEAADNGTLFLDEIGDMPLALQAKLLRALQEGEIERVGENKVRKVNVRVVAATNQPLEQKLTDGTFRQDLFYRLAVVQVDVPPLRTRTEDIPMLIKHFLARYGNPGATISTEALVKIQNHSWPGNVRELENLIMRACALQPDISSLQEKDIGIMKTVKKPFSADSLFEEQEIHLPEEGLDYEALEKRLLSTAWEQSRHNQTAGARLLGLPRQAFIYRLQKHGIISEYGDRKKGQ